jgi:GNAT superfamily N-acetyltransferase
MTVPGGRCQNCRMTPTHTLRAAEPRDLDAIVALIGELAAFAHLLDVTPAKLEPHLFGERPVAECLVGEVDGEVVAFALFFTNFSTFLAQPGLYLEDLYVRPAHRGGGLGKALLEHLGQLAARRGCGRFEWSVLDWNADAIRDARLAHLPHHRRGPGAVRDAVTRRLAIAATPVAIRCGGATIACVSITSRSILRTAARDCRSAVAAVRGTTVA